MKARLDVLLVDDDARVCRAWVRFLADARLIVECESNAFGAIRRLEKGPVLVVVSDQSMQGPSGTMLLDTVRRRWPHTGRVIFTGVSGIERDALAVEALLLSKDDRPDDIRRAIIAEVQDAERRHAGSV